MTNLLTQAVVPSIPSYCLIALTKGRVAIVDSDDFDWINQWQWSFSKKGYAVRREHGRLIYMHSLILGTPRRRRGDHWNGDALDNRRVNLRITTRQKNAQNTCTGRNNSSDCTGVCWTKNVGKWFVFITVKGKRKSLGYYQFFDDAVAVRKAAELRYYGEEIRLHCPARIIFDDSFRLPDRATRINSLSGHTGITPHRSGKWMTRVYRGKVTHYLGLFPTIELAVAARDSFLPPVRS